MYLIIKIFMVVFCLGGILYIIRLNKRYKNDNSETKDDIINYFRQQQAIDIESGIKIKDLPRNIANNPYLLIMGKDKTLIFKNKKYYLNNK